METHIVFRVDGVVTTIPTRGQYSKGYVMVTRNFIQRRSNPLALLCVVGVLFLAARGVSTSAPASIPASAPAVSSIPTIPTISGSATLKHMPNGTADLSWDPASHALTVKISLIGLTPSSMHPAHIHTGSCANQGNVIYPLTTVVADAHGVATSTTVVKNIMNGIPAAGWYVYVHNGPGLSTNDQFLPIVCGDVTNSNTSTSAAQSVHIMLQPTPTATPPQLPVGVRR